MNWDFERLSLWSFRLSQVCFALAWFLPVFPEDGGFRFPGAWAFVAAPFVAMGFLITALCDGVEPRLLLWATMLSITTTMNGVLLMAPFLREEFAARPRLTTLSAGLCAVLAAVLCHWPLETDAFLPVWSPVEVAWIASFVLMSASGAASCFAKFPNSISAQRLGDDD